MAFGYSHSAQRPFTKWCVMWGIARARIQRAYGRETEVASAELVVEPIGGLLPMGGKKSKYQNIEG